MKKREAFGKTCAAVLVAIGLFSISAMPAASQSAASFCKTNDLRRVEARATGPSALGIALAMKNEELRPGGVASARLFNRGDLRAGYGVALRIERYVDGQWSLDPASPKGPWPKKLGQLDPGGLSTCFRFTLPSTQPPGRYRFTVPVRLDQKSAHRSAMFRVRSS